jgi:hypothetical protein
MNGDTERSWWAIPWCAVVLLVGCTSRNLDLDGPGSISDDSSGADPDVSAEYQRWRCLVEAPELESLSSPAPESVAYTVSLVSYFGPDPSESLRDVTAEACTMLDPNCFEPVATFAPTGLIAPQALELQVPFGFDGYVRVTAPNFFPAEYYLSTPVEAPLTQYIPVLSYGGWEYLRSTWGIELDTNRGFVMLYALDCDGLGVPDVDLSLEVDSGVVPWILVDDVPVTHANPLATGPDGFGAFANMPPGAVVAETIVTCATGTSGAAPVAPRYRLHNIGVDARLTAPEPCSEDNAETVYARSAFRVRAGAITMTELRPPPFNGAP